MIDVANIRSICYDNILNRTGDWTSYEMKLQEKADQYIGLDGAIGTVRFVCNSMIRA